MKFKNSLTILLLLVLSFTLVSFSACSDNKNKYDMSSLNNDMDDESDFEEYIADAKRSARNENFLSAYNYLKKARMLGVSNSELSSTKSYIARKEEAYEERIERQKQARLERERQERMARQSQSYTGSSGSSSSYGGSGQKYGCKFHCVGQWDSWRGSEFHVSTPATNQMDAERYIRENYTSACQQYPFYSGGGGSASVGIVKCETYY